MSISPNKEPRLGNADDVWISWSLGGREGWDWHHHRSFPCSACLLTDIRPTMRDLSVGGYSDTKEHLWGVCVGGIRETSLWDALRGLWVRFLRMGVWEVPLWGQCGSLWGLLVEDTPLLAFLLTKAGKGLRTGSFWFSAVLSVSLCVTSPNRRLGGQLPSPPALTSWCLWEDLASASLSVPALCTPLLSSGGHSVTQVPVLPSGPSWVPTAVPTLEDETQS